MKCRKCGLENPPNALRCDCGYDFPSGTTKQPYSSPEQPSESARTKYIWLCVVVGILLICLATVLFNLTWMTCAGRLDELGKSASPSVLLIIVLGFSADRLWKSILRVEPNSDPQFKKKHRKFTLVASGFAGAVLGVSFLGGVLVGGSRAKEYARDQEMRSLLRKFDAQKIKNADFRKRMGEIRSVRPSTYEEYYRQCLTLESLLNQSQPDFQHTVVLVSSLSELINRYPELRTPKAIATVQFLKDMDDKDTQVLAAVREEISKVKVLAKLPNSQRSAYYNREIQPVLANEQRLAQEEKALVIKAQQGGIEVPADLSESNKGR